MMLFEDQDIPGSENKINIRFNFPSGKRLVKRFPVATEVLTIAAYVAQNVSSLNIMYYIICVFLVILICI